jgi:hypothetical protein
MCVYTRLYIVFFVVYPKPSSINVFLEIQHKGDQDFSTTVDSQNSGLEGTEFLDRQIESKNEDF